MDDKLTIKEIQMFRLIHSLRKIMKDGSVNITWHEHDFVNAEIKRNDFDGKSEEIDKFRILLSTAFGDRA